MRKLIAAAGAVAALLATTTFAAASSTASYTMPSHGQYKLCITNDLGYGYRVAQVQLTGLPKQPKLTAPAGWSYVPLQTGNTWTAEWDLQDPTQGIALGATNCGFLFAIHGKALTTTFAVNLAEFTAGGQPLSFSTTAPRS